MTEASSHSYLDGGSFSVEENSKQLELAWAAGFYDGEGCTSTTRVKGDFRYLNLQVTQSELAPLERFAEAVGIDKIYGPYHTKRKPHWRVQATNKEALRVIELLYPYLSTPKRQQFHEALAKAETEGRPPMKNVAEKLSEGNVVTFRPRGRSMEPRVMSGQEVTVEPVTDDTELAKGDVVIVRLYGRWYFHAVTALNGDRVQIGNNKGHVNGWAFRRNVAGRMVA